MNPRPKQKWIDEAKVSTIPVARCKECLIEFTPRNKYVTLKFCSRQCANINQWKNREKKARKMPTKKCKYCNIDFPRNEKLSDRQWLFAKFCSLKCCSESNKISDGLKNAERHRRRKGQLKQGSEAWLEKIKARTKEGMMKPDVLEKLKRPKGPLSTSVRMKLSDALAGIMPKNMVGGGTYPNIKRGVYECSKGSVYFRSKWEANYALYLDFLIKQNEIKDWEYEPDMFFFEKIQLGTRSYTPDFKIINTDDGIEYHEVKGYMDSKSKTKLRRMEIYFPEVKLILIDKTFYTEILKKLKGIVKFN